MVWKEWYSHIHKHRAQLIATAIQSWRFGHSHVQHTVLFISLIRKKNNFACSSFCDCLLLPASRPVCSGFQTWWKQSELVPRAWNVVSPAAFKLRWHLWLQAWELFTAMQGHGLHLPKSPSYVKRDGFFSSQSCQTEAFQELFLVNRSEQERPMLLCTWWMGRPVRSCVSPPKMG